MGCTEDMKILGKGGSERKKTASGNFASSCHAFGTDDSLCQEP